MMIRDNLVDLDDVSKYAEGYKELKDRATEYGPRVVSEMTGLPAEDIEHGTSLSAAQPAGDRNSW